jgi:hypothetical protein
MKNKEITLALLSLRPDSEWILRGDDYQDLEWLDTKTQKPLLKEVEDDYSEIKNKQIQLDNAKATAKAAAEAKLAALGLTADDLRALGL